MPIQGDREREPIRRWTLYLGALFLPLAFFGEKTISLGPAMDCPTHVLLAYRALGDYFGSGREHGIRVTISPWRKSSSKAMPSTVAAAGHYANSVLAMQDAVDRGFAEAILLNDRGEVAEGTGENIFFVKDGKIRTNDSDADVLHGITRATVIELARDLGYDLEIGVLTVDELFAADEVFFTSTAAEVTPLACIDDHVYATEKPVTLRYVRPICARSRAMTNGIEIGSRLRTKRPRS